MMRTSFYKTLAAGLGTALLAISVSGMAAETEYDFVVPAGAKAGDLKLTPCDIFMEGDDRQYPGDCGTLVVPENRNNPNSHLIALPVTRIKATGDVPLEPVFWFQGGPGGPNVYGNASSDGILQRHDLVMVGYRGIEGTVTLHCPEIGDAVRAVENGYLSDTALASYGRGATDCANRFKGSGVDLDGYSMNQTIDDMEAARIALGYDRINLFGVSYGTRLQMIYQWRYPDSINRVLMVAVNPPGHFIWDSVVIEQQLEQYAALCAKDTYCSTRTSDLVATMKKVSRNMPTSWMGIPIDADGIRILTFFSLMESMQVPGNPIPFSGPAVIDLWLDAAEGDASGMALASLSGLLFLPKVAERGHFLAMGGSALDYIDPSRDYKAELTSDDTVIGNPFSLFVWGMEQGWPATNDQSYAEVQESDIETLLVSGSIDFSTPMEAARDKLLPHLSKGHQFIVRDQGHAGTFWNSQAQARARLLNTFLDTGEVDDSLYVYQAPVFDVDKSWGGMAKMVLAILAIVLGAVVLLIIVIGRKLRSKLAVRNLAEA